MDDFKGVGFVQREIASVALELKEMVQAANVIFLKPSDAHVYSVTLNRRQGKGRQQNATRGGSVFHAELYNVGAALDETLYTNTRSIIYTSATLTVNGSFKPFEESVGLNTSDQSQAAQLKLDPCFDFDSNMKVYVVSDIPEPNDPAYMEALQAFLRDAHVAQGGAMLTLFTNKKDMDRCYSAVEPALKENDLRLVCQRWGVSVKGLRDDFVSDEALSLFALKSFWEGFDAPGATLRGVVDPEAAVQQAHRPLVARAQGARRQRLAALRPAEGRAGGAPGGRKADSQGRRRGRADLVRLAPAFEGLRQGVHRLAAQQQRHRGHRRRDLQHASPLEHTNGTLQASARLYFVPDAVRQSFLISTRPMKTSETSRNL